MNIIEIKMSEATGDPDSSRRALVVIEFEEYELQELQNEAKQALERGMSPYDARLTLERYDALEKAIKGARQARR